MTPNVQTAWNEIHQEWPDVASFGILSCRKIARSTSWSQHSWGNAWDITSPGSFGPRNSSNLRHMKYLDSIYRYLVDNYARLNVRTILWRTTDHWDHIHVDFWPKGYGTPPCAGGTLKVLTRAGRIEYTFGDDEEVLEYIKARQKSLNLAGFVGADGKVLEEDGILGPNTEFAIQAADLAATKNKDKFARKLALRALRKLSDIKKALE